jgi:hypothetical protein
MAWWMVAKKRSVAVRRTWKQKTIFHTMQNELSKDVLSTMMITML